jgi:hypothetical protein
MYALRLWPGLFILSLTVLQAQTAIQPSGPARLPNAEGVYAALRTAYPAGNGLLVEGLTLEREGGVFHFDEGSFYLFAPVGGRVTGAVYIGKGHFDLAPKSVSEQHSLALFTKSPTMSQDFSTLILRFTDNTADEIRKASFKSAGPVPSQAIQASVDFAKTFRQKLHENLELRLEEDVLGRKGGSFFLAAFRMGSMFNGRSVLFIVDPDGAPHASPDEVELTTYSDEGLNVWVAYRMQRAAADDSKPSTGVPVHVTDENLDVTFQRSGSLRASAETALTIRKDGLQVVRLNLYPTLRVSGVFNQAGLPLDFIQESKETDPDFAVILPQPAKAGEMVRILTQYAGPDAVENEGNNNYYLVPSARESWYPSGNESLGSFINFHMTFHLPKGLQIVATGKQISSDAEGKGTRVTWVTETPIPVAGFNLGDFKTKETKTPAGFVVDAYANANLPDRFSQLGEAASLGTMSTVPALNSELSQGSVAIQVYSTYFGKLPYDHIALTQQGACNFGQSWPMLVYLPICGFWDSTIKERLGLLDHDASYWKEVTPHEVSHQWWGQLVGFESYRDQWMSEGFANYSVGLFLKETASMNDYRDFWHEQQKHLVEKNSNGLRPIDVGPLTMGYRVSNEKSGGDVYQMLIYSKGAYIMHMLEMMYWTGQYGEAPFKHSMQQFVTEYSGKAATTEDLKASFERTMPKWLDAQGNGKLDWFFNEYVYGTELPHYAISSDFTNTSDGSTVHFHLTQSNVSKDFVMIVPLYLEMENGKVINVGRIVLHGNTDVDRTVKLGKLPSPGKKFLVNYYADILSD